MATFKDLTPKGDIKAGGGSSEASSGGIGNGLSKMIHNSNFWQLNIGHIALVAVVLIGWGRMSQQFTTLQESVVKMQDRIERIDSEGTTREKYVLASVLQSAEETKRRISTVEDQARKIDVLVEKTSRIDDTLKEIHDGVKR